MKTSKSAQIGGVVLTRKEGQTIEINGGEIRIEIVAIVGKEVRVAVKAENHIKIDRGERLEAKKELLQL